MQVALWKSRLGLAMVAILARIMATAPAELTHEDASRARVGMTLAELERMFGPPDQIDPRSESRPSPGRLTVPYAQMARWNAGSGIILVYLEDEIVIHAEFRDGAQVPPRKSLRERLGF